VGVHEQLATVDLFADFSSTALNEMVHRGTKFKRAPGSTLVEEGAADAGLYLILNGSAVVSVGGNEVGEMAAGDYFGEISLIDGQPRSATVTAGPGGAETFAISSLTFSDLLDDHPELARVMLKALTARIRAIEARQS
jgi:CRP/FNR family cyclic AMP-dependent transcriptional regulator